MRIALFGGSFNPPHIGHVLACHYVLHRGLAEKIFILPVHNHPLGKRLLGTGHRENMCRRLFPFNEYRIHVYDWERKNPSGRTLNLLREFLPYWPSSVKFKWIIGSDCMKERHKWEGFDEIEKMVELIPIDRFKMGNKDISSTSIRRGFARGEDVSWQMPKVVLEYIYNHNIKNLFTKDGRIV